MKLFNIFALFAAALQATSVVGQDCKQSLKLDFIGAKCGNANSEENQLKMTVYEAMQKALVAEGTGYQAGDISWSDFSSTFGNTRRLGQEEEMTMIVDEEEPRFLQSVSSYCLSCTPGYTCCTFCRDKPGCRRSLVEEKLEDVAVASGRSLSNIWEGICSSIQADLAAGNKLKGCLKGATVSCTWAAK
jgi:hypothetical protein